MEFQKLTFMAPSGHTYTIREQNGQDEEILTNSADAQNVMNITKFLQAIIVDSSRKPSKKLTLEEVLSIPCLDRYAIMFQARIFSLGNMMEFTYSWPNEDLKYEQDLNDFILPYDEIFMGNLTQDEIKDILDSKPEAIPVYPNPGKEKDIEITLSSGKKLKFDLLDGNGERYAVKLTDDKITRNVELIARNLHLEVDGRWDKVQNFSLFTRKDMMEMRKLIHAYDPVFNGLTDVENPHTGEKAKFSIFSSSNFFFPEGLD